MNKLKVTKILASALICASFLVVRPTCALIPVADAPSTANSIKDWFNSVKESAFVVNTVSFVSKTSSTIGDAAKSASEYVVKNKERMEKKLEKVKEYKEQYDEYKQEYDEYKKWMDDKIAEANRLKAEAEQKIADAKQFKSDLSAAAAAAKDMAQSKLGKDDSGVGEETDEAYQYGSAGSDDELTSGTRSDNDTDTPFVNNQSGKTTIETAPEDTAGVKETIPTVWEDTSTASSSRKPFDSASSSATDSASASDAAKAPALLTPEENAALETIQKKLEKGEKLTYQEEKIVEKAKVQNKLASGEPLDYHENVVAKTALAQAKAAQGQTLNYLEQKLVDTAAAQEKAANGEKLTEAEQKLVDIAAAKEKAAKGEALTEEEQKLLDEDAAEEKEAKDKELDKLTDEELEEKLKALDEEKADSLSNEFQYTREELEAKLKARDEAKKAALAESAAANKKLAEEIEERLQSKEENKRSSLNRATPASLKTKSKTPTRRSFGRTSALELPEVRSYAFLSDNKPLAFGQLGVQSDGGVDENGTYLIPRTIAKKCDLNSKSGQEKDAMDNCLVKLNDEATQAQAYVASEPLKTYNQGLKELAAAYIAEGYKAQNDADAFQEKVIDPISTALAPTTMDIYANIVEMNKAIATNVNNLLKLHSSALALATYKNYGDYKFVTPAKEDDADKKDDEQG